MSKNTMALSKFNIYFLFKKLPFVKVFIVNDELVFESKAQFIYLILFFLKRHQLCQYKILSYITAVDYLNISSSFELDYEIMSILYNQKLRIKIFFCAFNKIDSIESLYNNANWLEREIWDLFGVYFKNNFDLRRILTDYGFSFFPLRKSFPLSGFFDVFYNPLTKLVSYKNVFFYQLRIKRNLNFSWFFIV